MNNYERLIKSTQQTLETIPSFLQEMREAQTTYWEQTSSSHTMKDNLNVFLRCCNYSQKGEKLALFLNKLISQLSISISEVNAIFEILQNARALLCAKLYVYEQLSLILQKFPNGNLRIIRFKIYSIIPEWEDIIDDSTKHILHNMDAGLSSNSALMENICNILNTLQDTNGPFSTYKIDRACKVYEKQKHQMENLLSLAKENATILSNLMNSAIGI